MCRTGAAYFSLLLPAPGRSGAGEGKMTRARLVVIALCCSLAVSTMSAADFSTYRGIRLGINLVSAAKIVGRNPTEARLVHQRPAITQEIDWRPDSVVAGDRETGSEVKPDSIREATLSFFNGELFRIVVTYDRYRVEGLTADDIIQSIGEFSGPATKPAAQIAYHSIYGETAPVLARWEDAEYSWNLIQTGDRASFALILYSKSVDAMAVAAEKEAVRLDAEEAPQREAAKQQKRDADVLALQEKARSINLRAFRP
jgi:hypothetical protein